MGEQVMTRAQAVNIIIDAIKVGQDKVRSSLSNECIEFANNGDEEAIALYEAKVDESISFEEINGILANVSTLEEFAQQIQANQIPLYHLDDERIDRNEIARLLYCPERVSISEYLPEKKRYIPVGFMALAYGEKYRGKEIPEGQRNGFLVALMDPGFVLSYIRGITRGMGRGSDALTEAEWSQIKDLHLEILSKVLEKIPLENSKQERLSERIVPEESVRGE